MYGVGEAEIENEIDCGILKNKKSSRCMRFF